MPVEMLGEAVAGIPDPVRYLLAAAATLLLAWWTWRRLMGDGDDPSISLSRGGQTGYGSFLVSGVVAVVFVGVVWVLGLGEEVAGQPALLLIPGAFVVAHYYVEVRES